MVDTEQAGLGFPRACTALLLPLRLQRGQVAAEAQGERHVLCIPWGPKQLLACVKGDQDDSLLPGPPQSGESSTRWPPGEQSEGLGLP